MRHFFFLAFAFVLLGCPGHVADLRQSRIKSIQGMSDQKLQQIQEVQAAYPAAQIPETAGDFFEIVGAVKLELTDNSTLGDIADVVLLGQQWFVLDSQNGIYRFDFEGRFSGVIGSVGEGPGEYQEAYKLQAWGDLLTVFDSMRGIVIVYDQDGNFVRNLDIRQTGVYLTGTFFFEGDRWYIGDFGSRQADVPAHAILSFAHMQAKPALIGGFGRRFAWAYQPKIYKSIPNSSLQGFTLIEGRIWEGSPYRSEIEVYDRDGHHIARLPSGIDGVMPGDYQGVESRETLRALRQEKGFLGKITYMPPFVFAEFYKLGRDIGRVSVYDAEGNLIRKNLEYGKRPILGKHYLANEFLVSTIDSRFEPAYLRDLFSESEWQTLLAAGFHPETFADGNPILLLSHLRDELDSN